MMNSQNIDMTDIKTEEIWVDVEIVAKLKGITKRAVRLSLNNDKYEWKTEACRGGYTYKIKLSTLEVELQNKYIEEYVEEINASGSEVIELNNLKIKQEKLISQSQKEMALAKYDLLNFWLEYRKECKKNKYEESNQTINQKFVEMYNSGMLYENIFKLIGKVSEGTLYRWKRLLGYNGIWTCLVGQYKYSTRKE